MKKRTHTRLLSKEFKFVVTALILALLMITNVSSIFSLQAFAQEAEPAADTSAQQQQENVEEQSEPPPSNEPSEPSSDEENASDPAVEPEPEQPPADTEPEQPPADAEPEQPPVGTESEPPVGTESEPPDGAESEPSADSQPEFEIYLSMRDSFVARTVRALEQSQTGKAYSHTMGDVPDAFSIVRVTVRNQAAYDPNDANKNSIPFEIYFEMNDDYLAEELDTLYSTDPNFPQQGTSNYVEYQKAIDNYLLELESLEEPAYTFTLGGMFKLIEPVEPVTLKDSSGDVICTYRLDTKDDVVTCKLVMSKLVYNRNSTVADFICDANLKAENAGNGKVEVCWLGDDLTTQPISGEGEGEAEPEDDAKYTLTKTAPASVDVPYIDYTVEALGADDLFLDGLIFEDIIPVGLEVSSVSVTLNNATAVVLESGDYSVEGGKLSYTIPAALAGQNGAVTSARFDIRMALSAQAYREAVGNSAAGTPPPGSPYKNSAQLKDPGNSSVLATSNETVTQMKFRFISKSGQQDNVTGTRYSWTVDINTSFSNFDDAYLIDSIELSSMRYDLARGFEVYKDGGYLKAFSNIETVVCNVPFESLVQSSVTSVLPALTGGNKAVYYECGGRGIVVLPYAGLQNAKVQFRYYTDLVQADGQPQDENFVNSNTVGSTVDVKNDVKFLWRQIYYAGIGPSDWYADFTLDSSVAFTVDIASKEAKGYDPRTQTLRWGIKVNYYAADLRDVVISDRLPSDIFSPNDANGNEFAVVSCLRRNRGTGQAVSITLPKGAENKNENNQYYTLTQADATAPHILTLYLGDIPPSEYYDIVIATRVVDAEALTKQGGAVATLENSIKATATLADGKLSEQNKTASRSIPNALLTKSPVGSYDFNTHEFTWSVSINPNFLPITGATLTDALPLGTTFDKLESVTRKSLSGSNEKGLIIGNNIVFNSDGLMITLEKTEGFENTFSKDTAKFTFSKPIDQAFDFVFTTVVGEDYRRAMMTTDENGVEANITVTNTATLGGSIYGKAIDPDDATDDAVNSVVKFGPVKTGSYIENEGKIKWTVIVNRNGVDMTGFTIREQLSELPLDISPESIVVNTVKLDASGKAVAASRNDVTESVRSGLAILQNDDGFELTIPPAYGKISLELVFDAYLTDSAIISEIFNKVQVFDDGDALHESTLPSAAKGGYFDLGQYAHTARSPMIQILKVSSNSVSEELGDVNNQLPLAQTEFKLTRYSYSVVNGTYTLGEQDTYEKIKSSTTNGVVGYINLKQGYVYGLEETRAPDGYIRDDEPRYFLFLNTTGESGEATLDLGGGKSDQMMVYFPIGADKHYDVSSIAFTNTPLSTGSIEFTKVNEKGEALPGASFTATRVGGQTQNKTFVSDVNGVLKISGLDAGAYTLKETAAPTNYKSGGTIALTVQWNETTNEYIYAFGAATGLTLETDPDTGEHTVTDTLLTTSLTVSKRVDSVYFANQPIAGVSFTLAGTDAIGNAVSLTLATGSTGNVSFANVPIGSYTLTETRPNGYQAPAPASYQVKVSDDSNNGNNKVSVEYTPTGGGDAQTETALTVPNKPVTGDIRFTKTADRQYTSNGQLLENAPMSGVSFRLYPCTDAGVRITGAPFYTAVSDENGLVAFTGVEYGAYSLVEEAPTGYVARSAVGVTKADLAPGEAFSFTYSPANIKNAIVTQDLSITKTDQDGHPLGGVVFSVKRWNSVGVKDSETAYLFPNAQTDSNGVFTLSGLPYGYYELSETSTPTNIQEGCQLELKLNVTGSGVTGVYNSLAMQSAQILGFIKDGEIYKASVQNPLKYGFVQLKKEIGEYIGGNVATTGLPLAGAVFDIYYDSNGNGAVDSGEAVLLSLTTNAQGGFDVNDVDGSYTDANIHLLYGSYVIREQSAPAGYAMPEGGFEQAFVIGEDTTGHEGTAWISSGEGAIYTKKGELAATVLPVLNTPLRSVLWITKLAAGGQSTLSGAVFLVYAGDTPIASLVEDGETGVYLLSDSIPLSAGATFGEKNAAGLDYIHHNGTEWTLLQGVYSVTEHTAPRGYIREAVPRPLSVNDALIEYTWRNDPINLTLEKQSMDGISLIGAEYRIDGELADGSSSITIPGTLQATSEISARLIPGVDYTLTETYAPEGYELAPPIGFTVDTSGNVLLDKSYSFAAASGSVITIKDDPINVTIKKLGSRGESLTGAVFTISGKFAGGATDDVELLMTGSTIDLSARLVADRVYKLSETTAPAGYNTGEDFYLRVNTNGSVTPVDENGDSAAYAHISVIGSDVTVTNQPKNIAIRFFKRDAADRTIGLHGARFTLSCVLPDGTTGSLDLESAKAGDIRANRIMEAGEVFAQSLAPGRYTLTETAPPVGYTLGSTPYSVEFDVRSDLNDGDIVSVNADNVVVNERLPGLVTMTLVDKDNHDKLLPGVEYDLQMYNATTQTWSSLGAKTTSDPEAKIEYADLEWGDYRVIQKSALPGYKLTSDAIDFTVDAQNTNVVLESEPGAGVVTNELISVSFVSYQPNGGVLKGVQFKLTGEFLDRTETEISWVSGDQTYELKGALLAGNTYTLTQLNAPDGYKTTEPITFTVNPDGTVTLAGKTQGVSLVVSSTSVVLGASVKTGDTSSSIYVALALILLSGSVLFSVTGFWLMRKRKGQPCALADANAAAQGS